MIVVDSGKRKVEAWKIWEGKSVLHYILADFGLFIWTNKA